MTNFKITDRVMWAKEECVVVADLGITADSHYYEVECNGKKYLAVDDQMELVSRLSERINILKTSDIISLDYRAEYHRKIEECELLQAKYDYLWHTILTKEK